MQENYKMFQFYILLVDVLKKVRSSINWIVISREKEGYHLQKDISFDILSLTNQLYRSKSTYLEGLKRSKIYFSENQVLNLIK